ncbi:hypothetical protein EJ02DRAFT_168182 [Clathrospora elynae]|uniref:Uncharacterized protein n=1 Tax=Clathrospora elynae TaxID=706981 RepID=A0A6A5SP83_9PLEO|nr:hypothetical protein EJ02DRAFT_168182 [Clathrospora elynae]
MRRRRILFTITTQFSDFQDLLRYYLTIVRLSGFPNFWLMATFSTLIRISHAKLRMFSYLRCSGRRWLFDVYFVWATDALININYWASIIGCEVMRRCTTCSDPLIILIAHQEINTLQPVYSRWCLHAFPYLSSGSRTLRRLFVRLSLASTTTTAPIAKHHTSNITHFASRHLNRTQVLDKMLVTLDYRYSRAEAHRNSETR